MNIKFRKKQYTLLVIPENGKAAFSFRLPRAVILLIITLVLILFASIYALQHANRDISISLKSIYQQLSITEQTLDDTTEHKEEEIQALHNKIETLTRQAQQIQSKVAELQVLEEELRSLMGQDVKSGSETIQPDSLIADLNMDMENNQGGPFYPVEEQRPSAPVSKDRIPVVTYPGLDKQLVELIASLTEVKGDFQAFLRKRRITPTIYPTSSHRITSPFGNRVDPFNHSEGFHSGVDIAGAYNADVYATADGVITYVGKDSSRGLNVIIDHTGGLKTRYMHLSEYIVKRNQKVSKGETIGRLGSSGRSTGPHVHYEVIKNGKPVNPLPYLIIDGKSGDDAKS